MRSSRRKSSSSRFFAACSSSTALLGPGFPTVSGSRSCCSGSLAGLPPQRASHSLHTVAVLGVWAHLLLLACASESVLDRPEGRSDVTLFRRLLLNGCAEGASPGTCAFCAVSGQIIHNSIAQHLIHHWTVTGHQIAHRTRLMRSHAKRCQQSTSVVLFSAMLSTCRLAPRLQYALQVSTI